MEKVSESWSKKTRFLGDGQKLNRICGIIKRVRSEEENKHCDVFKFEKNLKKTCVIDNKSRMKEFERLPRRNATRWKRTESYSDTADIFVVGNCWLFVCTILHKYTKMAMYEDVISY